MISFGISISFSKTNSAPPTPKLQPNPPKRLQIVNRIPEDETIIHVDTYFNIFARRVFTARINSNIIPAATLISLECMLLNKDTREW